MNVSIAGIGYEPQPRYICPESRVFNRRFRRLSSLAHQKINSELVRPLLVQRESVACGPQNNEGRTRCSRALPSALNRCMLLSRACAMRLPDQMLNTVCFISKSAAKDSYRATGFIASVGGSHGNAYLYVATAKHVAASVASGLSSSDSTLLKGRNDGLKSTTTATTRTSGGTTRQSRTPLMLRSFLLDRLSITTSI